MFSEILLFVCVVALFASIVWCCGPALCLQQLQAVWKEGIVEPSTRLWIWANGKWEWVRKQMRPRVIAMDQLNIADPEICTSDLLPQHQDSPLFTVDDDALERGSSNSAKSS